MNTFANANLLTPGPFYRHQIQTTDRLTCLNLIKKGKSFRARRRNRNPLSVSPGNLLNNEG